MFITTTTNLLIDGVPVTHTYTRRAWVAAWETAKRVFRVLHAVITVSKRHAPKWLAVLLAVALAIPGPVDELVVLLIIGGMVAFKPAMRADMVTATREAWAV